MQKVVLAKVLLAELSCLSPIEMSDHVSFNRICIEAMTACLSVKKLSNKLLHCVMTHDSWLMTHELVFFKTGYKLRVSPENGLRTSLALDYRHLWHVIFRNTLLVRAYRCFQFRLFLFNKKKTEHFMKIRLFFHFLIKFQGRSRRLKFPPFLWLFC